MSGRISSRSSSRFDLPVLALGAAFALTACAARGFAPVPPPPDLPGGDAPEAVLYLVGDAGDPDTGGPLLSLLRDDATERSSTSQVAIAFMGDNIYDSGLHEPGHPEREHDVLALETQLDAVRGTGARGLFVSGNHDWGPGGERGLQQIRRQSDYIEAAAGEDLDVAFLPPEGGCPGPVAETLGETVLLVAIDTEWLLRYEKEPPAGAECEPATAAEAYGRLREILAEPEAMNRHVVVFAHHTLKTNGQHGGYFGVKNQLFPLTNIWGPLYIPIPFLYPIGRNSGVSSQDMSNPKNRRMVDSLAAAVSSAPSQPLAFASGHEHTLQVFRGEGFGADWLLVSGAGSRLTAVEQADALFAAGRGHGERGYMRVEFFRGGKVLLTVVTDGTGACRGGDGGAGASGETGRTGGGETCRPEPTVRYWSWLRAAGS
jgi:hypothetical protein